MLLDGLVLPNPDTLFMARVWILLRTNHEKINNCILNQFSFNDSNFDFINKVVYHLKETPVCLFWFISLSEYI